MVTHTAGPWHIHAERERNLYGSQSVYICGEGEWPESQLARVNVMDGLGEREANAALIAAAPDLLALVHQYRNDLRHPPAADSITRRLAAIDAVLAKVTGE